MDNLFVLGRFYKNKRILVTGHTGFKGSWLTEILIRMGAKVCGYSLPPDQTPSLFSLLELEKRTAHHLGDIRDYRMLRNVFFKERPDIVFHLAAQPLVRTSYDDPLYTFETNTLGTANVLEVLREYKKAKAAVIITTDKVYADKGNRPYKESDELGGYDPYSSSKAAAEIVVDSYRQAFFNIKSYRRAHRTLVATARAGNVVGGGDWQVDRLIPDCVRAFLEHKRQVVIRNPKSVRPWQFVLEPLVGYLVLGKELFKGNLKAAGSWNFGPNEKNFLPVVQVVQKVISYCGRGSYKVKPTKEKHETDVLKLDNTKARRFLKWRPILTLNETLELTMSWYNDFYAHKNILETTRNQVELFFKKKQYG